MLTTSQFQAFLSKNDLPSTGFLGECLKATWKQAEEAILGADPKLPKLLETAEKKSSEFLGFFSKKSGVCKNDKSNEPLMSLPWPFKVEYEEAVNSDLLTKSEVQSLVDFNKEKLSDLFSVKDRLAYFVTCLYEQLDDNPKHFDEMNYYKTAYKEINSKYNKLSEIQRKLKKMR